MLGRFKKAAPNWIAQISNPTAGLNSPLSHSFFCNCYPSLSPKSCLTKLTLLKSECKDVYDAKMPADLELNLVHKDKYSGLTTVGMLKVDDSVFLFHPGIHDDLPMESKAFIESLPEFENLGCEVFIISHMPIPNQKQFSDDSQYKNLVFVSDEKFDFANALKIPLKKIGNETCYPRLAIYFLGHNSDRKLFIDKDPSDAADSIRVYRHSIYKNNMSW